MLKRGHTKKVAKSGEEEKIPDSTRRSRTVRIRTENIPDSTIRFCCWILNIEQVEVNEKAVKREF